MPMPRAIVPTMPRLRRSATLIRRTLLALCAACALPACQPQRAAATGAPRVQPTPPPQAAVGPRRLLNGILIDSLLTNEVLRGALLSLDDVTHLTSSSDLGAFTFDSVLPGAHRLTVRHPLLDSLGLDTLGVTLTVGEAPGPLVVSLPNELAFVNARCPTRRVRVSEGLLLGVVRSAGSDQPIAGVEVVAAWRGSDSTYAGTGVRERLRVRSNGMGQFALCNTPRFTPVELWARYAGTETPRVRVQLGAAIFGAYDLSLESSATTDSAAAGATGMISGRILTLAGDGLPGVVVQLDRPSLTATTDSVGRFSFGKVPPGVRVVEVRAIGFRPSRVGISLRQGQRIDRDVTLDRTVAVLGTVTVRANRRATWDSVGFEDRRKNGGGYFFTRENLAGISDLATALRLVPGIRGRSNDRSQRLIAGRGAGCFPAFVVNGIRFQGGGAIGPEAMIRADDIRAIEVYTSRLSTPPEHQILADCAVVVIWLRDPQREREAAKQKP